jgi:hypothetical protein
MDATTVKQGTLASFQDTKEQTGNVAAERMAQNSLLSELPGVTFAFLTLAWIVLSFASLA